MAGADIGVNEALVSEDSVPTLQHVFNYGHMVFTDSKTALSSRFSQ